MKLDANELWVNNGTTMAMPAILVLVLKMVLSAVTIDLLCA
jgi:hypothetical protein